MEKAGKVSGSKPREMGKSKSENKRSEPGLPAIGASPNKRNPRQSIKDSADMYRLLVEAAGQAGNGILVLQDIDGKEGAIVFANQATARALGYGQEELLGMTMADIIHPDSLLLAAERYGRRQRGEGIPSVYELKVLKRDGTVATAAVSAVTTTIEGKMATMVFVTDVTERNLAEERLRDSEEKYRLLTENMNEGIIVLQDGKIVFCNPKYIRITGFPEEELLSRPFSELVPPDDRQMMTERYLNRLRGEETPSHL
jgi:PAS domain S-box-containing protein